jgi:hypothetical protein
MSTPQYWVGSTDVNFMLTQIGGWAVGCYNDQEAHQAVACAIDRGWVGNRTHYCPDGVVWPAYELTDAGLEKVKALYGQSAYDAQCKKRQWYRYRVPKVA